MSGTVVVRVLYVDTDGKAYRARTLQAPNYDGQPTQLLLSRRGRIETIEAKYSAGREPGTWSRLAEPV